MEEHVQSASVWFRDALRADNWRVRRRNKSAGVGEDRVEGRREPVDERIVSLEFDTLGISRGVFAPSISFNKGTFYVLNTCVDCGGKMTRVKDLIDVWFDSGAMPFGQDASPSAQDMPGCHTADRLIRDLEAISVVSAAPASTQRIPQQTRPIPIGSD